ncbi:DNA-binding protein [Bradyrhizobium manausense]|uniref:DNA-binding protein n=1 Tax=Bradyrhizobium manausense TaxID=989370 RepID=UPI001BAA1DA4|nr:DNA-binding protein [Bradyrhizobium manausense]MBR0689849.1 DNA-binding protein [Bradyrhizobium manausense]
MPLARVIESLDEETRLKAGRLHRELASATGNSVTVRVEGTMISILRDATAMMERGAGFAMGALADELTPEQAGKILGLSRPLVVRRMEDGRLPLRYEGAHRRCKLVDVLTLKAAEEQQQNALRELAEIGEVDYQPTPRF